MPRKTKVLVADFETTVYEGQTYTEVWAAASVEIGTEDVIIHHSIEEQFEYFCSLGESLIVYYHNLKFDGNFWLSYLLTSAGYKQAYTVLQENEYGVTDCEWLSNKDMPRSSFKYVISDMGQWYTVTIKTPYNIIELRDSLKLLPFSVKEIGKSFKTKHKKLDMEYEGFRYAGCAITDAEKEYIANDVLVVKEALEFMFEQGQKKLTIGSCCFSEFKRQFPKEDLQILFPNLYESEIGEHYQACNIGQYIQRAYRGGWCYLVKGKESKVMHNGVTADVNSLYPSMMHSESGNRYPVGKPKLYNCTNTTFEQFMNKTKEYSEPYILPELSYTQQYYTKHKHYEETAPKYYFIRFKCYFRLKDGYLPFVQIKGTHNYRGNECLESSDRWDYKHGRYIPRESGKDTRPVLTFTCTDFELFLEHYDIEEFEFLDGAIFDTEIGLFDDYIERYKEMKLNSTGALRTLAKLFLNNLYGKMASNTRSDFKIAYVKDDRSIGFRGVCANDKTPGYIPIGAAITSYARNFTIRAAQKNYYGSNKRGFIYADTDSIHCDLSPTEVRGITVHDRNFCCWKLESTWDIGYFVRQKTYIEHVIAENLEPIDTPYYNIKCAGMPERCKELFIKSISGYTAADIKRDKSNGIVYTKPERDFVLKKRTLADFNSGLVIPGKLLPKRILGGVLLTDVDYTMRL